MSRTIRRKTYEKTRRPSEYGGFKSGGFYTTCEYFLHEMQRGHGGCPTYRPMTEQERNERYWEIHGEAKHNNAWTPNHYYRNKEERKLRYSNELEIKRFLGNPEYEPQLRAKYVADWEYSFW